jgi:hypothetical protein
MPKKKIMHKFKMSEISTVDKPAMEPAKMVIMKRDDVAKLMFDQALEEMKLEKEVWKLIDEQWSLSDALQKSISSIVRDKESYPDPLGAVKKTLGQFASALVELVNDTEEAIDDEATKMEIGKRAWLQANPDNRETPKPEPEEVPMSKDNTPTVESLAADLEKVNAELLIAKSFGALNDAEKTHYATLDETAQGDFLGMTSDQRSNELAKSEGANPVVYTTSDGMEFRKNDDPRLVAMAKRADANEKIANEQIEKSNNLEIAKRIKEEIPLVPGEEATKTALYKAVDTIEDETVRENVYTIFKAHNETMKLALTKLGEKPGEIVKAEDALKEGVIKYQELHKVETYEQAYTDFVSTPEGAKLYEETQVQPVA